MALDIPHCLYYKGAYSPNKKSGLYTIDDISKFIAFFTIHLEP